MHRGCSHDRYVAALWLVEGRRLMKCQAEPFLLPRSCWGGWTPSLQGRSGPGLGSHSLCPRGRSMATSQAPSVHLSVHLSRRAPRVSFTPAPPGWFSGLSPADKKEHFSKARRISEKQVSQSPMRPLLWASQFFLLCSWLCFCSGEIFQMEAWD